MNNTMRNFKNKQVMGLRLGMAEGGIVRGQGGPTDDDVPMQVAGKDVNLSNSEAVLPVKTVQALGGPEAVEHLIETTNGKPPVRGGLRAGGDYAGGNVYEVDPAGNVRSPGQIAGALPPPSNPNAGTSVAPYQPPVTMSPAPPLPQPPGPSMSHQAGQAVRGLAKQAWANKGVAAGAASDAFALYNAHKLGEGQDEFNNDPSVPTLDKAKQFGRNVVKQAVPFAAGAIGSGVAGGTTFGAGAIAGGVGGYALGKLATAGVDEEGPELTAWRANNQGPRGLHRANMVDGPGNGTFEMPEFDIRGGDKELRAARKNGREGELAPAPAPAPLNAAKMLSDSKYLIPEGTGSFARTGGQASLIDTRKPVATAGSEVTAPAPLNEARATLNDATRMLRSANTDDRVIGAKLLRHVYPQMASDATHAAQAKEEIGLRRDTLSENARQFNQTLAERNKVALAAAREKGITNMTSMLDKSGYKDQEQVDFMDFVMQNHADNLSALPHAEQLKVLPRLKSDYQDMKVRNLNSTNGTSWKNGKRVKTDKLDYEKDAAIDPTGIIDNKIWFGDGSDGKGLGKANIFARKNLPSVFFGADDVDVMDNGQRIMSKDNRGARGPQGSIDMREINRLSLRDAAK